MINLANEKEIFLQINSLGITETYEIKNRNKTKIAIVKASWKGYPISIIGTDKKLICKITCISKSFSTTLTKIFDDKNKLLAKINHTSRFFGNLFAVTDKEGKELFRIIEPRPFAEPSFKISSKNKIIGEIKSTSPLLPNSFKIKLKKPLDMRIVVCSFISYTGFGWTKGL